MIAENVINRVINVAPSIDFSFLIPIITKKLYFLN